MSTAPTATYLTATQIPCCLCGTMILPNNANQCPTCLAQEFNLQEKLQRGPGGAHHATVHQCRQCRRFKRTEKHYEHAEPESPELLALCLKQIPALQNNQSNNIHLVDASWIWTEPHSRRFKLRLTVRTEIHNVTVQQRVMVELHCAWQMCNECNREFTNRTWHALVQIRQKRSDEAPKKGLAALEMALAKNKEVRKQVLSVDSVKNGLDFYFLSVPHAQAFVAYLQKVAPMRVKSSKKLVSTDVKNNTANMKHTITCDLVPLCRDDLVLVHKTAKCKLAGRLAIVSKVASGVIHLIDASPRRENLDDSQMELSAETYYKNEKNFSVLQASHRMARFVVLDVDLCNQRDDAKIYQGPESGVEKYALADVQVARESDFGVNDETFSCVAHLGHLVSSGDTVLGYDLIATVGGDWELEKNFHSTFVMPDVVLVKKVAGDSAAERESVRNGAGQEAKPRLSKRKERRRRKEGKRLRELEESAVRMGFIEDDNEVNPAFLEKELANDPELAAEVSALERDFEALGASMPAADSNVGHEPKQEDSNLGSM